MTEWALLLRAVNLGPRNKLAMADLRQLLTDLGHGNVTTYLNSGNATFTSGRRGAKALGTEVEQGLTALGLDVRVTLRTKQQLQEALDGLPPELDDAAYVLLSFLFDDVTADARSAVEEWDVAPDRVLLGDRVAYLGFAKDLHTSKLQTAGLEKRIGVAATGRTPATIRKMLA